MDAKLLFVYGTLRRDSRHEMARYLEQSAEFVGCALYCGKLYMIAQYPGVVASRDRTDLVRGDAFRLHAPAPVLRKLDAYEGCDPNDPNAPYVRRMDAITLADGASTQAWVYIYRGATRTLQRIASGDYIEFTRAHRT